MNPSVARWTGWGLIAALVASIALLVVLSTGKVLVSQRGALGGSLVTAEFRNAWPLVPGMTIRMGGTVAGSVESVDLTDRGTAEVKLRMARGVPSLRADATAAIRQQDTLGDTYVALDRGSDPEPLEGTIPTDRTITMPRLDEIFSTFKEPEREALKATLVTLAGAIDERGDNLNATIVKLRPAIVALDELTAELDDQQGDLAGVTERSGRLMAQLAQSTPDLDRGLRALNSVLDEVAEHDPSLDRTLAAAPQALDDARSLIRSTGATAAAARPLAGRLEQTAPELERVARLLPAASADLRRTVAALRPTVRQLSATMDAAQAVTPQLPGLDPIDLLLPATRLLEALSPVFAEGAPALFGGDSYGADPVGETGLGAAAVERGDQPLIPDGEPRRHFLRVGVVLNCQLFGRPVQPGCFAEYLKDTGLQLPAPAATGQQKSGATDGGANANERTNEVLMEWLMR